MQKTYSWHLRLAYWFLSFFIRRTTCRETFPRPFSEQAHCRAKEDIAELSWELSLHMSFSEKTWMSSWSSWSTTSALHRVPSTLIAAEIRFMYFWNFAWYFMSLALCAKSRPSLVNRWKIYLIPDYLNIISRWNARWWQVVARRTLETSQQRQPPKKQEKTSFLLLDSFKFFLQK